MTSRGVNIERFTDLELTPGQYACNVLILQPKLLSHAWVGKLDPHSADSVSEEYSDAWYAQVAAHRSPNDFLHYGTLHYQSADASRGQPQNTATPLAYRECRGELTVSENTIQFICTKCAMSAYPPLGTPRPFSTTLLHLMMKQMNPRFPDLSYIDITGKPQVVGMLTPIRVISLTTEEIWRIQDHQNIGDTAEIPVEYASLGFTVMPGVASREGFCGLDNWVRELQLEYREHVKKSITEGLLPEVLGPRG